MITRTMASIDNTSGPVPQRKERIRLQCALYLQEKEKSFLFPGPPDRPFPDLLFQPLFDDLLNPPPSVDLPAPKVIAPIPEVVASEPAVLTGSPSSTTVDQDEPFCSNSQTSPETQSPVISLDVE
ncbi:hypothetical protein Tco_1066527 [Tanacetum coccineum]|uniref:Uncharacterized protein n=1 Tax=Tanacetum coccineum TaxID=301880 RepID=A0ABQ5HBY4_9ASTR